MSLVDTVFAGIPGPLLDTWGRNITLLKATSETYSTTTGQVTTTDSSITVRAVITQVATQEFEGSTQTQELKVIIGNDELGGYTPTIRDRISYSDNGTTIVARIIDVKTYKGDSPVAHVLLARPQ